MKFIFLLVSLVVFIMTFTSVMGVDTSCLSKLENGELGWVFFSIVASLMTTVGLSILFYEFFGFDIRKN